MPVNTQVLFSPVKNRVVKISIKIFFFIKKEQTCICIQTSLSLGVCGGLVFKALCYKLAGRQNY